MRRGAAPDHVTRMMLLTVQASLGVDLGRRDQDRTVRDSPTAGILYYRGDVNDEND